MGKTSKSKAKKVTGKKTAARGKAATILEFLRRKDGATIGDLTKATGWQPHSVRGFLSAHVGKKLGLKLQSTKREDGQRVYQVVGPPKPLVLQPPGQCLAAFLATP
ncbi:MAG: DUF3489 domain-containing protein [Terriglobia bacterium]